MPTGSGAIVVHRMLEQQLGDYTVVPYAPKLTFFPPALRWRVPRPPADLIHTTPDYAPFLKRRGRPLVTTFHNLVVDDFMSPYSSMLQRLHYRTDLRLFLKKAIKLSDRITAVSQFTADLVRQELEHDGPIDVIPNGIDTRLFRPGDSTADNIQIRALFAGNPSLRKGAHWLPEMARKLRGSATVVCASGLRGGWTAELEAAGVELLGQVPYASMPELYQSVDLLLLPTVREGDSLAVLEAMSSGLPIVASHCSSLPERVMHGEGGYLCEIGDIDGFVAAIENLRDPQLRKTMGAFNRNRAKVEFDIGRMASRYEGIFAAVAAA
jgi:glycosyltransferase involved in cell wall biosynthesis